MQSKRKLDTVPRLVFTKHCGRVCFECKPYTVSSVRQDCPLNKDSARLFTAFLISLFSLRPQTDAEMISAGAPLQLRGWATRSVHHIPHMRTRTLRFFRHSISAKIGGNLRIHHGVTSIGKTHTVKIAPRRAERKWKKGLSIQRFTGWAPHLWQTARLYACEPHNRTVRGDWPRRDENDWMSTLGKYARFETKGAKVTLR